MTKRANISCGDRYGLWTIESELGTTPRRFLCVCACGTRREVRCCNLVSGSSRSCGKCMRVSARRESPAPRPRLEDKIEAFYDVRPDEDLTLGDVMAKFGVSYSHAQQTTARLIARGRLVRVRTTILRRP